MAVIVSNGATSLSTVNGFYRAEAYNLGMFSTTDLALSSTRTIAVTFANAGACQGLILALTTASASLLAANLKSVVVTLQENVATVWTDRATVTYSAATITNSSTQADSGGWIVPFTGGTFPYTVTTAASTWRFQVSQTGAQSSNWSIRTSDATNPFYVSWCNNAVSFASNDCVICKDVVTIDQTATFKGVLGTGDTTRSVCGIICKGSSGVAASVANLVWANPPAASYTLTLDGWLVLGSDSGFRIGTSASPISVANQAVVDVIAATAGTAANSGIVTCNNVNAGLNTRTNWLLFGEYPTTRAAILNASAAAAQPVVVTTTSTGWAAGQRVFVGGNTAQGNGDGAVYTISTVVGATITLTGNLAAARSAQARIVRLDGFGIVIKSPAATNTSHWTGINSNFQVRGVLFQNCLIGCAQSTGAAALDSAVVESEQYIEYSAFEYPATGTLLSLAFVYHMRQPQVPFYLRDSVFINNTPMACSYNGPNNINNTVRVERIITLRPGLNSQAIGMSFPSNWGGWVRDSVFEGSGVPFMQQRGSGYEISGNRFWGIGSTAIGAVNIGNSFAARGSNNAYDNCYYAMCVGNPGAIVGFKESGSSFGATVASTIADINPLNSYIDVVFDSCAGATTVVANSASLGVQGQCPEGSRIGITNRAGTTNNDYTVLKSGEYQRTGTGLTDTTARTAGGYAIRLAPNSGTTLLSWPNLVAERAVPTGNIQSKTMTVTAWVYINNAAYYAGTHTKPTLSVKYDNATTATAVATATAGSWQQLAVTFTPATAYGQIEVWLSGATDAAGATTYFYVDDVQVAYPAGVSINLGGLDLWANATPVWPPIATFPSLGSVWDEAESAHVVAGSYGERVTRAMADPHTGYSLPRVQRIVAAAVAGKTSGGPAGFTARNLPDTADQVTGTATADGNRTPTGYGS